ncbi:GroES-like protein [Trametes coccinea BRFM310]|uniref:GroES-like protein n=1 Tax=Trametes coccinea (strain BRFM310) TaxID=1353009 RepID=A0A1Y2ICV6_TRAC3|nr:GroES-like protein [Trametes coccinea BRFM310]
MSTPTQQKALFLQTKHGEFTVATRPVPKPGPGELLVKNEATGLNPVDWKIQAFGLFIEKYPAILGMDAAGVVEAVGDGVTRFKAGDQVIYEGVPTEDNDHATFQQYSLVSADLAAKLPDALTFEQGATIPLGLTTAVVGLYSQNGGPMLTPPWAEGGKGQYSDTPIVVIGGASAVGAFTIQFAKLSGFSPIIATASLKNAALLKGFGATHVLDRNLPAASLREEIVKIAGGPVATVYDAISLPETQNPAFDLLAPGGKLLTVLPPAVEEDKAKDAQGRTIVHVHGPIQLPQNVEFGKLLFKKLTGLLETGDIKPLRLEVIPGGLEAIATGLEKIKNGQVSGTKLVVRPHENA